MQMIFVSVEELLISNNNYQNITLALAGVAQAANLVNELAQHGNCLETAFTSSINSIYTLDSASVTEIYGGLVGIHLGLLKLVDLLNYPQRKFHQDVMRYFIGMLMLERKLTRRPSIVNDLRARLQIIIRQADYFSPVHPMVMENLANLYSEVIAPINPRIIISGKAEYLQATDLIHKIRALLLAGIRSAVLWRQLNGCRWQLLLQRKKIISTCESIVNGY